MYVWAHACVFVQCCIWLYFTYPNKMFVAFDQWGSDNWGYTVVAYGSLHCVPVQDAETIKLLNCSQAGKETVLNGSFKSAPRTSTEASIYLLICSPHWVLQVAVAVVVTLFILCGPCNYWWGCYHALLSAPRGTIKAEWVSHFCIHSIIVWQLFNFNSVSLVT